MRVRREHPVKDPFNLNSSRYWLARRVLYEKELEGQPNRRTH